jgi:hypothetical protein
MARLSELKFSIVETILLMELVSLMIDKDDEEIIKEISEK